MALLGCIADDFTGATDLAAMLARNGMRTVQVIGVPDATSPPPGSDAIVVALKSRTAPVQRAVRESRAALTWLARAGCRQFFFKYCSTFDSTEEGNIGPVADALVSDLGCGFALACPAFPANRRSVFQGHLFVGQQLLSESGMESHPLTPMRDANLLRVLGRQTDGVVGLVPYEIVERGAVAIRAALGALKEKGCRYGIVDALNETHLRMIGTAAADAALITGGSGVAMGLADNFRALGLLPARADAAALPDVAGGSAILAGSCARATLMQIGRVRGILPDFTLRPLAMPDAAGLAEAALAWADDQTMGRPILIAASAPPETVAAVQTALGRAAAGALMEEALAAIAAGLVARGVRRLIVAGGESAGAVVTRLGIARLRIGAEIDPGVPWTYAEGSGPPLLLALKSGNFGAPDFFLKAFAMLEAPPA